MPLNYTVNFGDRTGTLYRIEIDNPDYSGDPIELTPSDTPLVLSWEGNSDDDIFKTHVIPSSISIGVVSTGLDFDTLFYINDTSFKTRVYRSEELYWSGHLISDGVQEVDSGVPFDVTLTAIDGISLLDGVDYIFDLSPNPFSYISNDGITTSGSTPLDRLRYILFWDNLLDNPLPIRWNSSLKNDTYPESDMLAGLNNLWGVFYLQRFGIKTGKLTNDIVKSSQSWLYQKAGYWYINRYFDSIDGTFNGKQIGTNTETIETAVPYNGDDLIEISPQDVINESWFWFGKKPLGGVSVEYDNTTFENGNVVPNGYFQLPPSEWYMKNNEASLNWEGSITNRDDSLSVEIVNDTSAEDYLTFGTIPIDTDILYKECKIGLKWLPISGYTLDENDNIDFSVYPMHISVKLTIGANVYYLNEFGYWSDNNAAIGQNVSPSWTGNTLILQFLRDVDFLRGDTLNLTFVRSGNTNSYTILFPYDMPYNEGVAWLATRISGASQADPDSEYLDIDNVESVGYGASITRTDDYYRKLQLDAGDNFKLNDVIDFQFVSKASSGDISLPSGKAYLTFEIYSKPNSVMRIADVFFTVPKNNDIYNIDIPNSRNTKDSYSMGISSGWSGNQVSSYGDSYKTTDESEFWNGGKTLTELYGRAIMDVRNRPCRVFSGTVDRVVEWSLFSLMGHVYAPLSMRVNIKDRTTEVVGVEFAPNSPIGGYVVEHRSSGAN